MSKLASLALVAAFCVTPVAATTSATTAADDTKTLTLDASQRVVWQGELDYWKYVNARDSKRYLSLWSPDFTGWPCDMERPTNMSGLRPMAQSWFADLAAAGKVTTPTPEAVIVKHNFAITYLSAATRWTDKDGKPQSQLFKFVHTWNPTPKGWKIIGGMCGPLERRQDEMTK